MSRLLVGVLAAQYQTATTASNEKSVSSAQKASKLPTVVASAKKSLLRTLST